MDTSKIEIVASTDKWCVMPLGVMITSVCVNNPNVAITFHILHDDSVSDKDRSDLEDTVAGFKGKTIAFYAVDITRFPCLQSVPLELGYPQSAYYRLVLTELLPPIPKVLYLDADIIVRHSLMALWNTDIEDSAVGVVPDGLEGTKEFYDRLDYPSRLGYFNSGVMLINLNYWRRHNLVTVFMDYLQENTRKLFLPDQDLLNYIFKDCKITLPITYNFTTGFLWTEPQYDYRKYEKELLEARKDPVILHFAGNQPWIAYNPQPPHPFASSFFKYQNMTKWKGRKIDKRSYFVRVKNYIGDMLRLFRLKSPHIVSYRCIDIPPID